MPVRVNVRLPGGGDRNRGTALCPRALGELIKPSEQSRFHIRWQEAPSTSCKPVGRVVLQAWQPSKLARRA